MAVVQLRPSGVPSTCPCEGSPVNSSTGPSQRWELRARGLGLIWPGIPGSQHGGGAPLWSGMGSCVLPEGAAGGRQTPPAR